MIPIPSVSRVSSLTSELFEMEGSNPLEAEEGRQASCQEICY